MLVTRSGTGEATVGTKLAMAISKVSKAGVPVPSEACTEILTVPTSALVGVPLKVRDVGSKDSQEGSAAVPDWKAV